VALHSVDLVAGAFGEAAGRAGLKVIVEPQR
jgi:hypothetical protein